MEHAFLKQSLWCPFRASILEDKANGRPNDCDFEIIWLSCVSQGNWQEVHEKKFKSSVTTNVPVTLAMQSSHTIYSNTRCVETRPNVRHTIHTVFRIPHVSFANQNLSSWSQTDLYWCITWEAEWRMTGKLWEPQSCHILPHNVVFQNCIPECTRER